MAEARMEINIAAFEHNLAAVKEKVGKSKVMAMVKANAYGHGAAGLVRRLKRRGREPDYYGVAFLNEALELQAITEKPVLMTEPMRVDEYGRFSTEASAQVLPTLTDISRARALAERLGRECGVHVKINTGLNRLGVRAEKAAELIGYVLDSDMLSLDGVFTHFAQSSAEDPLFTQKQLGRFRKILSHFKASDLGLIHAANSGALLRFPESHLDMVRPGILLYGYYPAVHIPKNISVTPVMSLFSYISSVDTVFAGESVGYGRAYTAEEDHTTASIAMGYADGVRRALSGKMEVCIGGVQYRQIGLISMDRLSIHTGEDVLKHGKEVTLVGDNEGCSITLNDWANLSGVSVYELLCGIGGRFKKVYI